MVYVLFKPHLFVPLHFFVVICLGIIDKHSKCWNKIRKVIEFVCNLSNIPLIFFNPLQFKFYNCIIIPITYCPIVFQKNINYTIYIWDFNNKYAIFIKCKYFFFLYLIFAKKIVSYIANILIWHILYCKIYDLYFFLFIHLLKALKRYLCIASLYAVLLFIALS